MKKITFLIAFLLSAMLSGHAQHVSAYTRTALTGQTYTPITGGTVINTDAGLAAGVMSVTQDDGAVIVTLPFTFTYGGATFTKATFCTNGWVGMGDQSTVTAAQSRAVANIFTTTLPNNMLGAWFGDLGANFPTGNGSMVHGSAGTDVYAFEWRNAVANGFSQNNNVNVINFMVKLYGPASATPGRIEYLYGSSTGTVSTGRAIALENATGGPGNLLNALNGSGLSTATATAWPGSGNGYRFDPNNAACTTVAGGTLPAVIAACGGVAPPTLEAVGATIPLTGITYAWEQSTDGGTAWVAAVGGTGATTRYYTPPVYAGAPVKYRLKVTCTTSTEFAYSTVADFNGPAAPSTQATTVAATNAPGQFLVNWASGSGNRRIVIVSDSPIVDPVNDSGPALTAPAAYAGGQQIVYDGTGSSVTVTGIPCSGGTYYIKVYEYNRCGSAAPYSYYYNTTAGSNAITHVVAPVAAPVTQASALTLTPSAGQFVANWTNGSGNRRLVIVDTTPIADQFDETGVTGPTGDASWNNNGPQVVYDGTAATVTVTGLSCVPGDVYYVKVFEYNRCGVATAYDYTFNNTTGTNVATNTVAAPSTQATATAASASPTGATITWTNGNGAGRIVLFSDAPIIDPADMTDVPVLTGATLYVGGEQIVYVGTGTTVTVSGLTCNSTYYVKVYEYYRCGAAAPYSYTFNTTTGTNGTTVSTVLPTVALPQATTFTGFTTTNLGVVAPGWYESAIATTAGETPSSSNPTGSASTWRGSTVFSTPTAAVNLYLATRNEWIISPKMTVTAASRLKFKAAITNFNTSAVDNNGGMVNTDDAVVVMISTDGCGSQWTPLYVFQASNVATLSNVLTDFSLPIDGAYIGQDVQIAFQAWDGPTDDLPDYDFHIGSVVIELVPACDVPVVATTDAVTTITETGATVNWGAAQTGTPSGYQYVFATANTAPTGAGTDVAGTTVTVNNLLPSTKYFTFVRTVCSGTFSNWVMVATFTTRCDAPEVLTPTGATRCGLGAVTLSASTTAGATLNWYAAETGGSALATGNTYSPSVTQTTTYYVSATGGLTEGTSAKPAPTGVDTFSGNNYGIVFTATEDVNIVSTEIYSTTAGTVNVAIQTSTGVELYATGDKTVAAAGTTVPTIVPINFVVPAGTAYRMIIKSYTGVTLVRDSSGSTFPYNGTDGKLNVTNGWTGTGTSTSYYYFYKVKYEVGCASLRTPVTATVTAAPAITAQASSNVICGNGSTNLSVTSSNADYTYTWMPGNLTGPAQTVSPTQTTTYTVTATDATTNCAITQDVVVTVNAAPTPVTVVAPASACENQVVALTATGGATGATTPYCTPVVVGFPGAGGDYLNNFTIANITNNGSGDAASDYTYYSNLTANMVAGTAYPISLEAGGTSSTYTQQFAVWVDLNQNGTFEEAEMLYASTTATFSPTVTTGTMTIPTTAFNGVTRMRVGSKYSSVFTANQVCQLGTTSTSAWGEFEDYNVNITGATNAVNYVWSPTTGLYTDMAGTVAYTGTPVQTVYAKITGTATYTATATAANSCTAGDDHVITLNGANTPTGSTSQTINAATPADATIEDIVVTETGVIWYATEANAIAGVSPLAAGTQLAEGSVYYGTLSTGSCVPLAVTITEILGSKGFDKSAFAYYPNPVKDMLNLKYSNEISGVQVYNLLGQIIISKEFNATEATLDMSGIADGHYIVRVSSGNSVETIKIVKKQ